MIKYLSAWIRDYFGFSRTETRGLFFLLFLITVAIFGTIYIENTAFNSYQEKETDLKILDSLMREFEASIQQPVAQHENEEVPKTLFPFNPNASSFDTFRQLGISERLTNRILSYRNKGGRFYQAKDLLKIYDFPLHLYKQLEAYIDIPEQKMKVKSAVLAKNETLLDSEPKAEVPKDEKLYLDINHTDSLQLKQLKGIGTVLSARIVKYRDQLGGFHNFNQLKEVYHISDDALKTLEDHTFIKNDFETKKIKINELDFKSLLKHPYIDYELAKAIMNHRRIYGNFSSTEQLREVYYIKEELLVKLLPYIVI
ncbi:competence protein ComEA [Catalinimonas alkaloidigena]|uniref:ComEA family DNA-binding protein n=1 Tax=Catalinimonas alkaloidigena TaxID=1075417 RepID=UPI002406266D|nr:helix-hairpin-helix domain-containing protein [Catalinimonas alkaloidigena]MDF9797986.1 competence protein ComEA [Catalinimonas alkaloidigena]